MKLSPRPSAKLRIHLVHPSTKRLWWERALRRTPNPRYAGQFSIESVISIALQKSIERPPWNGELVPRPDVSERDTSMSSVPAAGHVHVVRMLMSIGHMRMSSVQPQRQRRKWQPPNSAPSTDDMQHALTVEPVHPPDRKRRPPLPSIPMYAIAQYLIYRVVITRRVNDPQPAERPPAPAAPRLTSQQLKALHQQQVFEVGGVFGDCCTVM